MIQKTFILFSILFFISSNLFAQTVFVRHCSEKHRNQISRICGGEKIDIKCFKKAYKCFKMNEGLEKDLSEADEKNKIDFLKKQKCPFVGKEAVEKWKELKKEHKEELEDLDKEKTDWEQKVLDLSSKILELEQEMNTELVSRNKKTQEAMDEWNLAEKELKEQNKNSISALHKEYAELNKQRKDIIHNQYRKLKLAKEEKLAELQAKCYKEALERQMQYDQKKRALKAVGLISRVNFSRNVHLSDKAKRLKRFHAYRLKCLKANKELKQKINESYKHARINLKREQKVLVRSMIGIQQSIRSLSEKLPNDLQEKLSQYNKKTNLIETEFTAKQESLSRQIQLKNAELREVRIDLLELDAKKENILSTIENKKYLDSTESSPVFDDLLFITNATETAIKEGKEEKTTEKKDATRSLAKGYNDGDQMEVEKIQKVSDISECVHAGIGEDALKAAEKEIEDDLASTEDGSTGRKIQDFKDKIKKESDATQ